MRRGCLISKGGDLEEEKEDLQWLVRSRHGAVQQRLSKSRSGGRGSESVAGVSQWLLFRCDVFDDCKMLCLLVPALKTSPRSQLELASEKRVWGRTTSQRRAKALIDKPPLPVPAEQQGVGPGYEGQACLFLRSTISLRSAIDFSLTIQQSSSPMCNPFSH